MTDHEMFMSKALDEARGALRRGEVPVGCVLVYAPESPKGSETVLDQSKRILGVGSNRTNELKNVSIIYSFLNHYTLINTSSSFRPRCTQKLSV
jgi:tRNA(Arg) A34 adenosine deaminase TadA